MKFEIVSQVKFDTITEADLTQMLKDKIAAENPNIIVNAVNFIPRQRPSRIEVEIDASFAADTPVQPTEPEVVTTTEEEKAELTADDALIDAQLDEAHLAELDSQYEVDAGGMESPSVIDEIDEQSEQEEDVVAPTKISEMFQ